MPPSSPASPFLQDADSSRHPSLPVVAPRIVYAGTPEFAVPALQALIAAGWAPCAVYTQPDRPAGRGRQPAPSPVKRVAEAAGIPIRQPVSLRSPEVCAEFAAWQPDVCIVAAYGLLLPPAVLAIPRYGCINLHASLLPRWRGAAPVQRAILAGDAQTGVCLMQMEAGLDTGPVLDCRRVPLDAQATTATVLAQLAAQGADLLVQRLPAWLEGSLSAQPQPVIGVCHARKLEKAEAWIDWQESAVAIHRKIRAFDPWPIAQTALRGEILRIHAACPLEIPSPHAAQADRQAAPGTLLHDGRPAGPLPQADGVVPAGLDVLTGHGILRLLRVQSPGRKPLPADAWARGVDLTGSLLATPPQPPDAGGRLVPAAGDGSGDGSGDG
jgi:methionyl-tRNA formyltransferase